ncbi:serine hydrolase domain-containing protein [Paenibacillus sp. 481]|uniref:serine hydrolase domain-containing protein n=1 Tax=Paenibacillus sp. 481 TaxID=2835869 RepID=UPI001E519181|nr:serine hydrolase domain-containing protein [Paenibacillus sp. 481]UHA75545.1 beta-lactamase family protein [Paenibacillus sp. 481]
MNVKKKMILGLAVMTAGTTLLYANGGATLAHAQAETQAVNQLETQAKSTSTTPNVLLNKTNTDAQKKAVTQALDDILAKGVPGVLAQSLKDGVKWDYAAGKANVHSGRSMQPDFHFRIGSTSKTFTATVALQLVGEGKLSLDDTLEKWLPGVVQGNGYDASKITLKQLLNMTSGIASYTSSEQFTKGMIENRFKTYQPDDLVKMALQQKPLFAPGTQWSYSNTNTVLVSLMIEKATGQTHAEQIKQRIIEPLKLTHTYVPGKSQKLPEPHARGYYAYKPDKSLEDFTEQNVTVAHAAGEMISSNADINRFFSELLSGKLLKPEQMKQMFESPIDSPLGRYGLGIYERKLSNGHAVWGHDGSIPGYATFVGGTLGGKHVINFNINLLSGDIKQMTSILEAGNKVFEAEFAQSAK